MPNNNKNMRIWSYIKSPNERFLAIVIIGIIFILLSSSRTRIQELPQKTPDLKWTSYKNHRFDYIVSYPNSWSPKEESTNGDGVALYDDGYNEVLVYGNTQDPQYPDDFVGNGQVIFQKPFKLSNGEKGTLLYVGGGNNKVKYIMYIDHKINSELFVDGYYKERYVVYASVSDDFLDDHLYTLNRIMESFIPPPANYQ